MEEKTIWEALHLLLDLKEHITYDTVKNRVDVGKIDFRCSESVSFKSE